MLCSQGVPMLILAPMGLYPSMEPPPRGHQVLNIAPENHMT